MINMRDFYIVLFCEGCVIYYLSYDKKHTEMVRRKAQ